MTKTKLTTNVNEDSEVIEAAARRAGLAAERDEALATLVRLRPEGRGGATPFSMQSLVAQEKLSTAEEALAAADGDLRAAQDTARERLVASAAPARVAVRRRLLTAIDEALAAARAVEAEDTALARALGQAPPPHPVPGLLTLVEAQADQLRRALDPPLAAGPAPVPVGHRRVRFLDRVNMRLQFYVADDVADLPIADVSELVRRNLAEVTG